METNKSSFYFSNLNNWFFELNAKNKSLNNIKIYFKTLFNYEKENTIIKYGFQNYFAFKNNTLKFNLIKPYFKYFYKDTICKFNSKIKAEINQYFNNKENMIKKFNLKELEERFKIKKKIKDKIFIKSLHIQKINLLKKAIYIIFRKYYSKVLIK